MNLSLSPRLRTIARCQHCNGSVDEHNEGCPVTRLESLQNRQKHIQCPKWEVAAVDVNNSDFYECRACHTQYCLVGGPKVTNEKVYLVIDEDAPIDVGVRTVYVLAEKGKGEYPFDELIAELQKVLWEQ